ncbi:MAG: caspase family protein [Phycisphaerales bacterium]|nr:caspase family protein [Phycisphaerales bacterium]
MLVLPVVALGQTEHLYARRIAVSIGNNTFDPVGVRQGWWGGDLRLAESDAAGVADALRTEYGFETTRLQPSHGGPELPLLLLGSDATRDAIFKTLDGCMSDLGRDDVLVIFYSGHGVRLELNEPDKPRRVEGYIVPAGPIRPPSDATAAEYGQSLVSMTDLADKIRGLGSRGRHVLLLLDCCFSGLAAQPRGASEDKESRLYRYLANNRSRIVITAGTDGQLAFEPSVGDHGYFTQALLNTLADRAGRPDPFCATEMFNGLRAEMLDLILERKEGIELSPQMRPLRMERGELVFVPAQAVETERRLAGLQDSGPEATGAGAGAKGMATEPPPEIFAETTQPEIEQVVKQAEIERQSRPGEDLSEDPAWRTRYETYEGRAAAGDQNAMTVLHVLTLYGMGTPRDERAAFTWASEASDLRSDLGTLFLARCYQQGISVPKSPTAAQQVGEGLPPEMRQTLGKLMSGERITAADMLGAAMGLATQPEGETGHGGATLFDSLLGSVFQGEPHTTAEAFGCVVAKQKDVLNAIESMQRGKLNGLLDEWKRTVERTAEMAAAGGDRRTIEQARDDFYLKIKAVRKLIPGGNQRDLRDAWDQSVGALERFKEACGVE